MSADDRGGMGVMVVDDVVDGSVLGFTPDELVGLAAAAIDVFCPATGCFLTCTLALGMRFSRSSGEQILQVQLSASPLSSVASQRTWAKKSPGLRNLFLLPSGCPYR